MKTLIALFVFLILLPVAAIAQVDSTAVTPVIPVPGNVMDIFADLKGWFASTTAVAGLTIFLTLTVAKFWKTITPIWKQVVALILAMLLMAAGNVANFGFMAEFTWPTTLVYGLVVGFMANGLYDLKNLTK